MTGNDSLIGDDADTCGVQARAEHLAGPLARYRIPAASYHYQAGAAHAGQSLDVAIKRLRHAHQVVSFVFEHFGHAELGMLGMPDLRP